MLHPERFFHNLLSFSDAAPDVPGWPRGPTGRGIKDYFSLDFPARAAGQAEQVRPCAENPFCLGVFTDNELGWGPSAIQVGSHVDAYMTLPAGAPGKLALQEFFESRYGGDIAAFNAAWDQQLASFDALQAMQGLGSDPLCEPAVRTADRRAFVASVAGRYYQVVHDALRAAAPEVLILSSRFISIATAPEVLAAAAPYVDVIAVNNYQFDASALSLFRQGGGRLFGYLFLDDAFADLQTVHDVTGRPVMITEYSFRTPTEGAPTLFPPFFPTFETQAERADAYERYMDELLARPFMIGAHWFQYYDQPATGRSDGENSRFGVVTVDDEPDPELTERMTEVNAAILSSRQATLGAGERIPAGTGHNTGTARAALPRVEGAHSGAPLRRPTVLEGWSIAPSRLPLQATQRGVLGERIFSVAAPQSSRTGFYVYILPGQNLAAAVSGGPLVLEAGQTDANGVAPIRLRDDALIGLRVATGDIACLKLAAAGSSGSIACEGGEGHGVRVTRAAGPFAPPSMVEPFLGTDSGPGAATLLVPLRWVQLPVGASFEDCLTTDQYGPEELAAFSTGEVTTVKGDTQLVLRGENFVRGPGGVNWRQEDGPGMFVLGLPTFDSRVPHGDLAAALQFADAALQCE